MAAWSVLTPGALGLCGLWGFFAKLGSDNLTPKSAAVMQGMGAAAVAFIVLAFTRYSLNLHHFNLHIMILVKVP